MALTLTSKSFKDGDHLAQAHILSADYGFGCGGGNTSPHFRWDGVPAGTKSFVLRCLIPTPRRGAAPAVGRGEHPARRDGAAARRRESGRRQAAGGRAAGEDRFRQARLRRPVPARGRPSASLPLQPPRVSLDTLPVTANTAAAVVAFYLNFNTLAKVSLMGLYRRS